VDAAAAAMDTLANAQLDPLLERLPDTLRQLAARGVIKRYRKGTLIIDEGSPGDTLYILLEGSVKAFSSHLSEREITYAIDRAGDYFGEMSLDGGPRSASIIALEPTICAVVTARSAWDFVEASPAFARELIHKLIGRARWATERARELALHDVYTRVARLLETLAAPADDNGERRIAERMTHLAIAGRVGASREMVSRLLKDLERGGYLGVQDGRMVLFKKLPKHW
jgi:CRP/FNR family cyclic AMP-dependent transcriptional regulator